MNREIFGRPGVIDYRNAALAAVLKTLGYVQRCGVGIAEARRALAANGNPPLEFAVRPTLGFIKRMRGMLPFECRAQGPLNEPHRPDQQEA